MDDRYAVVVIGGGTAGISVAARLRNADPALGVAVIDPAGHHDYQPLWTLVGGGMFPREASRRTMAEVIPPGVTWIREAVESFDPERSRVTTRAGRPVGYDVLVAAPGLQVNWGAIPGLAESVGTGVVCSNYAYEHAGHTWEVIRGFRGGTALFTQPSGAVKCGGAPQKIMYLAEETFRRRGMRGACRVVFATATPRIFAVDRYARTLERIVEERGIDVLLKHELASLRPGSREAVFRRLGEGGGEVVLTYDMIHVTPPMGPPDFVRRSPLADGEGWVDVDPATLRHVRYPNVFGLGDASNLPTSKTGAAIRKQAPVVAANVLATLGGRAMAGLYDGYTSCPLVTGYGGLVLAEFDYSKGPAETFPFDQSQPRFSMMMLKKHGLPAMYWHGMLKGRI
jgi:sulfide:quinone oxidoreductase